MTHSRLPKSARNITVPLMNDVLDAEKSTSCGLGSLLLG